MIWKYDYDVEAIYDGDYLIADVYGEEKQVDERGYLLAAAPELLEALENFIDEMVGGDWWCHVCGNNIETGNHDAQMCPIPDAQAAIRKAKGEEELWRNTTNS